MKKIIITWFLVLSAFNTFATDQLSMFVGEIKILDVGAIDRIAVGKGDVLSTSMLDNGQLLILAEASGETTIHIWYTDGAESDLKVQILESDNNRVVTELRALLSDLKGVTIRQVGQKIFLTGTLNCFAGAEECAETEAINTILGAYPDVINLTRTQQQRPPNILPSNKMVSMDVKITEFNTNKLSSLGIDWSDVIAGPFAGYAHNWIGNDSFSGSTQAGLTPAITGNIATNVSSALGTFGLATEISSIINLLVSSGDAIILAQPKLSSRSGGNADFVAGGEIPVVTSGGLGTTNVEYKPFGILLNISPVVDDENNIFATVSTEVSAVDQSIAQDPPGFITRKTSTEVSMHDGETLVMSGLISRDINEAVDKFPLLGDIPILGALFRSTDWQNRLTELVIFVTPTVFDAKSKFNRDSVNRSKELIDTFEKNVDRGDLILD
ncbi:MAG TPA: pilus assembly protein N-terminal domain-containing protein [Gammaproteobacteria bacterium]|nr:pilus assembly protein N-terminal domain-containing protein [Gammaproteobacteria bacterium]